MIQGDPRWQNGDRTICFRLKTNIVGKKSRESALSGESSRENCCGDSVEGGEVPWIYVEGADMQQRTCTQQTTPAALSPSKHQLQKARWCCLRRESLTDYTILSLAQRPKGIRMLTHTDTKKWGMYLSPHPSQQGYPATGCERVGAILDISRYKLLQDLCAHPTTDEDSLNFLSRGNHSSSTVPTWLGADRCHSSISTTCRGSCCCPARL